MAPGSLMSTTGTVSIVPGGGPPFASLVAASPPARRVAGIAARVPVRSGADAAPLGAARPATCTGGGGTAVGAGAEPPVAASITSGVSPRLDAGFWGETTVEVEAPTEDLAGESAEPAPEN